MDKIWKSKEDNGENDLYSEALHELEGRRLFVTAYFQRVSSASGRVGSSAGMNSSILRREVAK